MCNRGRALIEQAFTRCQVKHHGQHGSGRFADLLKKGKDFAKDVARRGVKTGLQLGKDWVEDKILDKIRLKGDGFLDDIGLGLTLPQQEQLMAMHAMHGSGFFTDALKSLARFDAKSNILLQ